MKSSVQVDLIVYNSVLSALEKSGQWQRALFLLQMLETVSWQSDEITYSCVMGACGRQGLWQATLKLLEAMRLKHVEADLHTYTAAISACSTGSQWAHALGLLLGLEAIGLQSDAIAHTAVIQCCAKGAIWQEAVELMNHMALRRLQRDLITHNSVINACVEGAQWQWALDLLQWLPQSSLRGDAYTYSITLRALGHGDQWLQSLALLGGLAEQRLLNTAVLNSAIASCGSSWRAALEAWGLFARQNLQPDGISHAAAIGACEKRGKWQQAVAFLQGMGQLALRANVRTCTAAVGACKLEEASAEQPQAWSPALRLLASFRCSGLQEDDLLTNYVIKSCTGSGCWEQALAVPLWEDMDVSTCNSRISACSHWQMALALFNDSLRTRLPGDPITYSTAIGACERGQQWLKALGLLAELQDIQQVDAVAYTATIGACASGLQWQHALALLAEAACLRMTPDDIMYTTAATACVQATRWELTLDFLGSPVGKMTFSLILKSYLSH